MIRFQVFHDTPARYTTYLDTLKSDPKKRMSLCEDEINSIDSFAFLIDNHKELQGRVEKRIVHNDTKVNNIMFSKSDPNDFRIIDLDTMMADYLIFDFGDMIRTGVSDSDEDDKELSKVSIRFDFYEAIVKGFIQGCGDSISEGEKSLLFKGAQIIIFEQAVRFLNDFLQGDPYYKTDYEEHNLVRTRTQLKLLTEITFNEKKLKKVQSQVQLF